MITIGKYQQIIYGTSWPYKFLNKTNPNFYSLGLLGGNFYYENYTELYDAIEIQQKLKQANKSITMPSFCFIDVKTEYYKLFFDLDMSSDDACVIGNICR